MSLLCLVVTALSCLSFSGANKYIPGKITPFLNQSSQGVYRFRGGSREGLSFESYWYQDDLEQKLALGIGKIGTPTFQAAFWFFKDVAYEMNPSTKAGAIDGVECKKIIDFNYTMEVEAYSPNYLSSMGVFTMEEAKERTRVELYAGVALDGVGPLNVVCVQDTVDGTYVKMYTIQSIGTAHFSEYYLYPRNDSRPADWGGNHVFQLHRSCLRSDIHVERFFDVFNMKGERIDRKNGDTAMPISTLLISVLLIIYGLLMEI